jgi:5'-nucleotidase
MIEAPSFPPLTLAVSSQSLFNAGWNGLGGVAGWQEHQWAHRDDPMSPGPAFPFVSRLLDLSLDLSKQTPSSRPLVEVHLVSRQDHSVSARLLNTCEAHGLGRHFGKGLQQATYLGGKDPLGTLQVMRPHLFLSTRIRDVRRVLAAGFGGAHLEGFKPPEAPEATDQTNGKLIAAFDGDAVLFGDEAEAAVARGGLEAFYEEERRLSDECLTQGPLYGLLMALEGIRRMFREAGQPCPLNLVLVTARGFQGQRRVQRTLREWGVRFDQMSFLSGAEKGPHLQKSGATIFFDDSIRNIHSARRNDVPAAHVPWGVSNATKKH